jgi:hypothetical protein
MGQHFTPEQQQQRLSLLKYGRWARDLSTDELFRVLCLVHEYVVRSPAVLPVLEENAARAKYRTEFARALIALRQLATGGYRDPLPPTPEQSPSSPDPEGEPEGGATSPPPS